MPSLLIVFARAPLPGRVKTRLIPAIGAEAAARLHAAFVDDVCALTRGVADERTLAVAGAASHPLLAALAAREGMALEEQAGSDLGERMDAALAAGLRGGFDRVAIVGSDAPLLPRAFVRDALAGLDGADVVLGPAEDGGYWLVGARAPVPWLFADMAWGTAGVLAESLRRLRARGVRHALAGIAWDVDEPADLARLRAALARDPDSALAPATRAALADLGDS